MAPIIGGFEGCTDEPPLELPEELKWAESDETISTSFAFLANEANAMASAFVPLALRAFMESWVARWDGRKAAAGVEREEWLVPAVGGSGGDDTTPKINIFCLSLCCWVCGCRVLRGCKKNMTIFSPAVVRSM